MSKISLNPKYTNNSGNSWSTTTYNGLEYHISTNNGNSSVSTLKCEFTTPYDNIDIVIEIGSSSENNYDWCYVGKLDYFSASYDSNYLDRISGIQSNYNPLFKTVTINVAKAGTHFLIIGYRKDGSGNVGHDCGYFRLVTTEVDSLKPDPYIYCGTKTVVSEEPIKFTKKNISNGNNGQRNWYDYGGTSKDYLWQAAVGDDNSLKTAKISFTTSNDNATIILKYSIRLYGGSFKVSKLDGNIGNNLMIHKSGDVGETITKEITVPKAGEHFIWIGYDEGSFGAHIYVGFFGTNVVANTINLVPERILANNKNIGKVYVGSELIWSKSIHNTISWETLTWDKSNNSYTYNTKGKLYISYYYDNNNYETYLLSSPASVMHPDKITKVIFYNINSYQGNSYNCTYKLDLSEFNTYKFNSMYNMFNNCYSLTSLDVSNFNTSNVTNINSMFHDCRSLTSLDVSKWDTSNVTYMKSIFSGCNALTYLDVSKWNTSNVTNMAYMFYGCNALTNLNVSNWDTSNVNDMGVIFYNCSSLTSLDVSKWNTSNVTYMPHVFYNCSSLTSLDVSKWNTSNVTYMKSIFSGCNSLTSLDVSKWNVSNVTSMYAMFDRCSSLTSLDVSKWNVSNVTSMYAMFNMCSSITSLDVSKWDTSKVTDMQFMFFGCNNFTSLNVSNFNTSNVTNMYAMFYNCPSLTSLDVSKWDTSKVTNMQFMFSNCNNLTKLDLSKWDVSNVTNINNIFYNSSSLTTLIYGHEYNSYLKALNKLKVDIDLSPCVKLNYESIYAVFNGLATVTGKTINLPSVMKGRLDETKVKIATNKGWRVAYK